MPIYEYQCSKCGEELEVIQKFSDEPLVTCPECKENCLEKRTSASAFMLKGGGWYKDGYSGPSNSKKTETKSATKPSTKNDVA